ncbi:CLUMA_CG006918, isoform A [Clunio marinus]|uniref:CLUMA_CG006918, isoform A n=1 Tax=Clunio marinus TaxID=568069 RepID=A0A1J1I3E4_9DIPT|nr:CLUMA_CG006918, isoform A [Clunio marinus]
MKYYKRFFFFKTKLIGMLSQSFGVVIDKNIVVFIHCFEIKEVLIWDSQHFKSSDATMLIKKYENPSKFKYSLVLSYHA